LSPRSGSRGHELKGIFGGVESGRVGLGIRNEDDQSYWRIFSTLFRTLFFEYQ